MDSLRGIPVEHKLETYACLPQAPLQVTPKNWPCRSERHSALDTQNNTVTLKRIPHTSNNTLLYQHPAKPFRLKHPTSLNTTSLAAPRTNRLKAANKNFRCCVCKKAEFRNSFVCLKTIVLSSRTAIDPYLIMLSVKQSDIKYHFWVFGITRPVIEPRSSIELRSSWPMANTLLMTPFSLLSDLKNHMMKSIDL